MIQFPLEPIDEFWVALNIFDIRKNIYEISNYGNVRRIADKFPIKHQILVNEYGAYRIVNLVTVHSSQPKKYLVHRLVGILFVPNPYNYPQINHINNNGMDECSINLEWSTPEHNTNYQRYIDGLLLSNLDNYSIYKMIESGMDNKSIIDVMRNPIVDNQYIEEIRKSYIRNNPISEFDQDNMVTNSSKFTNDFIRCICELFEDGMTHLDFKKIAEIMGVDISSKKSNDTFRQYCSNIYKRKHHTHISKKYNW